MHPKRNLFRLCRYFSIASLISIVIAALTWSFIYRTFAIDDLTEIGERQNVQLAKSISNAIGFQFNLLITSNRRDTEAVATDSYLIRDLNKALNKQLKGLKILKVKIFNTDGITIYSTDNSDIGNVKPFKYPGRQSAEQGKIISKLSFRDTFNSVNGLKTNLYVLSSYVPVQNSNKDKVDGVLEIYTDVTSAHNDIMRAHSLLTVGTIFTLLLLYAVLYLIVKKGEQVIIRQSDEQEGHLEEIQKVNDALHRNSEQLAIARDQAFQASKAKSHFLANMSHELRTPLNAIIGYSELLEEDLIERKQEDLCSDLHNIRSQGHHLLNLIDDVLDISKIEAGKLELFIEELNISKMIEELQLTIAPLLESRSNILEVQFDVDLGTMKTDVTKTRQILLNLLSNANKFSENATIRLTINRIIKDGVDWLFFDVKDAGIGMNQQQQKRIFEPFNQADDSTTRNYGGTGLGLTICKQICNMMGGIISVKSEPGSGSCFTIQLPAIVVAPFIEDEKYQPVPDPAEVRFKAELPDTQILPERRAKLSTVLVIDDDPNARNLMQRFLHRNGFSTVLADNAEEGLRLAKTYLPDLITLDVMMPGIDGWTVLRVLKEDPQLAHIPVVMATMVEDRNLGFSLGAAEYLTKPLDWSRFADVLRGYVRSDESTESIPNNSTQDFVAEEDSTVV